MLHNPEMQEPKTQQAEPVEFAQISWAEQMTALVAALRARGHAIPENATVSLVPVPAHLRDASGRPLYRVALVTPDETPGVMPAAVPLVNPRAESELKVDLRNPPATVPAMGRNPSTCPHCGSSDIAAHLGFWECVDCRQSGSC